MDGGPRLQDVHEAARGHGRIHKAMSLGAKQKLFCFARKKKRNVTKKSGRVSATILGCVGELLGISCHRHVRGKKKKRASGRETAREGETWLRWAGGSCSRAEKKTGIEA